MAFIHNLGINEKGLYFFLTIVFCVGVLLNIFYFLILYLIDLLKRIKEKSFSFESLFKKKKQEIENFDIFNAIEQGDIDKVKELLDKNINILQQRDKESLLPIHKAIIHGKSELAELFLDKGTKVDVLDGLKRSPLHWASMSGQNEIAIILIARGAKINVYNENGETPLHNAASTGNLKLAETLIKYGANPDAETEIGNLTAWETAMASGHKDLAKFLHSKGSGKKAFNIK